MTLTLVCTAVLAALVFILRAPVTRLRATGARPGRPFAPNDPADPCPICVAGGPMKVS
jgi:hypothetical protein